MMHILSSNNVCNHDKAREATGAAFLEANVVIMRMYGRVYSAL